MYKRVFLFLTMFVSLGAIAQTNKDSSQTTSAPINPLSVGIGVGLDYGGLGADVLFTPYQGLGVFVGLGYNMVGLGWNTGIKVLLKDAKSDKKVTPYFVGMYGYNAVIKAQGVRTIYNISGADIAEDYRGFSFGGGLDWRTAKGVWSFKLLVPIRSSAFKDKLDYLKRTGYTFKPDNPYPVLFSIGHFLNLD